MREAARKRRSPIFITPPPLLADLEHPKQGPTVRCNLFSDPLFRTDTRRRYWREWPPDWYAGAVHFLKL